MHERRYEHELAATVQVATIDYSRLFRATAWRAGTLFLAYVGWVLFWGWPAAALGPLRADTTPLVLLNVGLAAVLLGLGRIGIAAARAGDLW